MTEQDLINLLEASFPDAEISVSLDGSHVDITVVAAEFEGLAGRQTATRLCTARHLDR